MLVNYTIIHTIIHAQLSKYKHNNNTNAKYHKHDSQVHTNNQIQY